MVSILPPQIVRMDDLEGVPAPWPLEKMGIRPLGSNSYALDEKQPIIRERQSELEHALEYWSDWLTESGATVQTHVRYEMSLRNTAASIQHAASELDADVIAMRTHARRGLSARRVEAQLFAYYLPSHSAAPRAVAVEPGH